MQKTVDRYEHVGQADFSHLRYLMICGCGFPNSQHNFEPAVILWPFSVPADNNACVALTGRELQVRAFLKVVLRDGKTDEICRDHALIALGMLLEVVLQRELPYSRALTVTGDDERTSLMIRSPRKVQAVINNARCYRKVREEFGSFCDYIWGFSDGKTILYNGHDDGLIPVSNGLSDRISKDLKKRGFKYVGAITIYSHLQACGIINDHDKDCPCYQRINSMHPTVKKRRDKEVK